MNRVLKVSLLLIGVFQIVYGLWVKTFQIQSPLSVWENNITALAGSENSVGYFREIILRLEGHWTPMILSGFVVCALALLIRPLGPSNNK